MQSIKPSDYILIDIANNAGFDKISWDDRIEIGKNLLSTGVTLDTLTPLVAKGIAAYKQFKNGQPTGFLASLDATASGLQIMAALSGCKVTAEKVNLISTGKREDIYQRTADKMSEITNVQIAKDDIKNAIMTHFYGSKAEPKSIFGEDTYELEAFYNILATELPGASEVMEAIQSCWNDDALRHEWTLPDGHVASVKVMKPISKKVTVNELDDATFTYQTYENCPIVGGISLAANIVHSIDGYIVRQMYRMAEAQGFDLVTIHDSFWAHPNYMQKVRENYAQILSDIAKSNLLQDILNEITGTSGEVTKKSEDLWELILDSEYALS